MLVVVTYDVNTVSDDGRKRLRHVARCCANYGQRVQNSVFECVVTPSQYIDLKLKLSECIDHKKDSLRMYILGKNWQNRIEYMGRNNTYDPERDTFVF